MSAPTPQPPSLPVAIPPSTSTPVGDVVTQHEGDALVTALADHFYAVACGWAMRDGNPVEALAFDRFLVAAQDAVASLDLASSGALHRAFPASWGEQHCVTCYKPWPCPDANAPPEAPDA